MTTVSSLQSRGRLVVAIVVLALLVLAGGSSRIEVPAQVVVRLVAIAGASWALLVAARGDLAPARPLLFGLGLAAALMAATLVPLPPGLWSSLPGRGELASELAAAGVEGTWRPLALLPTEAWSSLLSLTVPVATLLVLSVIGEQGQRYVLMLLIALAFVSGLLGLVQLLGLRAAYLHSLTDIGLPVGLFANRNHQAALLALVVPMTVGLAYTWVPGSPQSRRVLFAAGLGAVLILPLILATASRAGLILGLIGLMASGWMIASNREFSAGRSNALSRRPVLIAAGAALLVLVGAVALIVARRYGAAFDRLFGADLEQELRYGLLKPIVDLGWHYFPLGSGPGSFVEVFKIVEAPPALSAQYLNHAHNEFLELFVEGGAPAMAMLVLFLLWWGRAAFRAWRGQTARGTRALARVGTAITLMLMVASSADYPLRTASLACVFAVGLYWMARASGQPRVSAETPRQH